MWWLSRRKKGTASSLESTHQVNLLRGVSIKDTTTNQLASVFSETFAYSAYLDWLRFSSVKIDTSLVPWTRLFIHLSEACGHDHWYFAHHYNGGDPSRPSKAALMPLIEM